MNRNYFIVVLAHPVHGRIKRLKVPHYFFHIVLTVAIFGAIAGIGFVSSYSRMLTKVTEFNQIRSEKVSIQKQFDELRQSVKERDLQLASLGSLASEVSIAFGIRRNVDDPSASVRPVSAIDHSLSQFDMLQSVHLPSTGSAVLTRLANTTPSIWPIKGRISSSFGNRVDPFLGKGAFHPGVDLSTDRGTPVVATADGIIATAGWSGGYGKLIEIRHGANGLSTRYAHLTEIFSRPGQVVRRGEVIGRAGSTGRSTSSHLHYEVRYKGTPVNPYKYLRQTEPHTGGLLLAD